MKPPNIFFVKRKGMASSIIPRYTYNDYQHWKEDWELIKGYPYQLSPSAKRQHSRVQVKLLMQAELQLEQNNGCNCTLFVKLDWKISNDTVVKPDIMIACGDVASDYLEFPPVLIIEIISAGSIFTDRNVKFDLYRENDVKYYIMCDYIKKTAEVFELIDNVYRSVSKSSFNLTDDCVITLDFSKIF